MRHRHLPVMGTSCSNERKSGSETNLEKDDAPPIPQPSQARLRSRRLSKARRSHLNRNYKMSAPTSTTKGRSGPLHELQATWSTNDKVNTQVKSQSEIISQRLQEYRGSAADLDQSPPEDLLGSLKSQMKALGGNIGGHHLPENALEIFTSDRLALGADEDVYGFDFRCRTLATPDELEADKVLAKMRAQDDLFFKGQDPVEGYGEQKHTRFAGDHFLSNADLIKHTAIWKVAHKMPKGAHLHIHFNACLEPRVLLKIAMGMDNMTILSDILLDGDEKSWRKSRITFALEPDEKIDENQANTVPVGGETWGYSEKQKKFQMNLQAFEAQFPTDYPGSDFPGSDNTSPALAWLVQKLVFHEDEVHNKAQTSSGAWELFNGRTQMMKGLFNYESAYRQYLQQLLKDFLDDNIQYAEIRPNFMPSNYVWSDNGKSQLSNPDIMRLIISVFEEFQAERKIKQENRLGGLKVIYCTPRSFPDEKIVQSLTECLKFKTDEKIGKYIAGFDLVGEEGKGRPLVEHALNLLAFQHACSQANVEVPFLFHCGETLEMGTPTDGNLLDALLLKSKRIGHGFSLIRHPVVMERMKAAGTCLEICPISNEQLGLTPRIGGHAVYGLLANNVHCTVNSDNGTLFRSTLSHDFYQMFVGKKDMSLFGWKQLILWSLEHSCWADDEERRRVFADWETRWKTFIAELITADGEGTTGTAG